MAMESGCSELGTVWLVTGLPFGRLYWSEYENALVPVLPTCAVIELDIGDATSPSSPESSRELSLGPVLSLSTAEAATGGDGNSYTG